MSANSRTIDLMGRVLASGPMGESTLETGKIVNLTASGSMSVARGI